MIKVIMHGCNGHMGQVITGLTKDDAAVEIVAGIDMADSRDNGYPVFTDIKACDGEADAMIDFILQGNRRRCLDYCVEHKLPLVLSQ